MNSELENSIGYKTNCVLVSNSKNLNILTISPIHQCDNYVIMWYMKLKRMGIREILRRIWSLSANETKSTESLSKKPNSSSNSTYHCGTWMSQLTLNHRNSTHHKILSNEWNIFRCKIKKKKLGTNGTKKKSKTLLPNDKKWTKLRQLFK